MGEADLRPIEDALARAALTEYCNRCPQVCCRGGIAITCAEAEHLVASLPLLAVDGVLFLDTERDRHTGRDETRPICPAYQNRRCRVYDIRPLICRLFPVELLPLERRWAWFLSGKCPFVQTMPAAGQRQFKERLRSALAKVALAPQIWAWLESVERVHPSPSPTGGHFLLWAEAARAAVALPAPRFSRINNGFTCVNCAHDVAPAAG